MSPVLGFSSVGSGVGGGVQSSLEPQSPSPSGQYRGTADRPFSVRSVRASGTSFRLSPGFRLTARLPMAEPESPGSGLKLEIRAVGGPAQSEFCLLSARERPPGTRPPSSPAPSSPRAACLRTLGFSSSSAPPSGFLLASHCRISSQSTFL
uniref:Uncharacterized protein n=1 Tax=Pipistrellus kuhlii TaxID=59472 RepID=A0A7J7TKR2_PIPKU|nr:hypothetical protein mPipKuh1_009336 [Pipistrellus kuhlii]